MDKYNMSKVPDKFLSILDNITNLGIDTIFRIKFIEEDPIDYNCYRMDKIGESIDCGIINYDIDVFLSFTLSPYIFDPISTYATSSYKFFDYDGKNSVLGKNVNTFLITKEDEIYKFDIFKYGTYFGKLECIEEDGKDIVIFNEISPEELNK